VAATRARDLLVVPVVGDKPIEGCLEVLNPAIYPPQDTRRSSSPAPGCPALVMTVCSIAALREFLLLADRSGQACTHQWPTDLRSVVGPGGVDARRAGGGLAAPTTHS
jgi:hypothetical protein